MKHQQKSVQTKFIVLAKEFLLMNCNILKEIIRLEKWGMKWRLITNQRSAILCMCHIQFLVLEMFGKQKFEVNHQLTFTWKCWQTFGSVSNRVQEKNISASPQTMHLEMMSFDHTAYSVSAPLLNNACIIESNHHLNLLLGSTPICKSQPLSTFPIMVNACHSHQANWRTSSKGTLQHFDIRILSSEMNQKLPYEHRLQCLNLEKRNVMELKRCWKTVCADSFATKQQIKK